MTLILSPIPGIPMIQPGDDLASIILSAMHSVERDINDGDIFVLAQKIVSKAEGRLFNLATVVPSQRALDLSTSTEKDPRLLELVLQESQSVLRTRPGTIIVEHRLGFVCANAGIDHSNVAGEGGLSTDGAVEEWVLLLPKDPDASARTVRKKMEDATGKRLGVLIIDSHGRAWRMGTVGVAIGFSGMPGMADLRGWTDLFGYTLRITQVGVADELAAAASLIMGQAAEGTPVVQVSGFPYTLREGSLSELIRPRGQDMFR
jgi:coenzyme F420-0:L-glutamate ligase / coenzyme F420-1:gamma-L-glutamate ligase